MGVSRFLTRVYQPPPLLEDVRPMKLNISQLLDYQRCPVYWHHKYISRRTTSPTAALNDGTYWHALAEVWLKGEPLLPESSNPVQDRMRQFVENGGLPKFPVLGTEVTLEMDLGNHRLVGRASFGRLLLIGK